MTLSTVRECGAVSSDQANDERLRKFLPSGSQEQLGTSSLLHGTFVHTLKTGNAVSPNANAVTCGKVWPDMDGWETPMREDYIPESVVFDINEKLN